MRGLATIQHVSNSPKPYPPSPLSLLRTPLRLPPPLRRHPPPAPRQQHPNPRPDRKRVRRADRPVQRAAHDATDEEHQDCQGFVVSRLDGRVRGEELGVAHELDPDGGEDYGGCELGAQPTPPISQRVARTEEREAYRVPRCA